MSANLLDNSLFMNTADLLDVLESIPAWHPMSERHIEAIDNAQTRMTAVRHMPDDTSDECKAINDALLTEASRSLALALEFATEYKGSALDAQRPFLSYVEESALLLADEDLNHFQAFAVLLDFKTPNDPRGDILLRNAYGAAREGGPGAELESYADFLKDIYFLSGQKTEPPLATDALDLRNLAISVNEGSPEHPGSSLTVSYPLGNASLPDTEAVIMSFVDPDAGEGKLNTRGFYAPELTQGDAIRRFRDCFYAGEPELGISATCEQTANGLKQKLKNAIAYMDKHSADFAPEVIGRFENLKSEIREIHGADVAPEAPLPDMGITDPERDSFYMQ